MSVTFVSCVYSRDALSSVHFFLSWTIFCCLVIGRFTSCLFLVGSRSPCFDLPHTNSVHLAFPSCRGYGGKQRCFVLLNFSTRNWIYFVRNTFICRLGERTAERQGRSHLHSNMVKSTLKTWPLGNPDPLNKIWHMAVISDYLDWETRPHFATRKVVNRAFVALGSWCVETAFWNPF